MSGQHGVACAPISVSRLSQARNRGRSGARPQRHVTLYHPIFVGCSGLGFGNAEPFQPAGCSVWTGTATWTGYRLLA
jgi:hypothetical protein